MAESTQQPSSTVESNEDDRPEPKDEGNPEGKSPNTSEVAAPPPQPASTDPRCPFCRIIAKELSSNIIYEDSDYVCFVDRSPVTTHHYLVAPREHIRDAQVD